MAEGKTKDTETLAGYTVKKNQHSISGLSSGAFMTVQLHLAHSSSFIGAGVIAGGPYRCVESFPHNTLTDTEDAYTMNALYSCMTPLIPQTAPNARRLAALARQTAAAGRIDAIKNIENQRLYLFTGSRDTVVNQDVVKSTRDFYEQLGVKPDNIKFIDNVPAGHSIITDNVEDSDLGTNQPPYINYGGYMQSHDILSHIYGKLLPPAKHLTGDLIRFDQSEFVHGDASMATFGYVYVPQAVKQGKKPARGVHIALHGCKQGYNYINYVAGVPDTANQAPFGNRYITTTGYNHIAETNDIIVLYPQATGDDDNADQNPDGCWDWWGYTSLNPKNPDYYSKEAIQISAIFKMLERLCSGPSEKEAAQSIPSDADAVVKA